MPLYNLLISDFYYKYNKWSLFSLDVFFRGVFPPAEKYGNLVDKPYTTLVEAFRSMEIEGHLENGDIDHEV